MDGKSRLVIVDDYVEMVEFIRLVDGELFDTQHWDKSPYVILDGWYGIYNDTIV